MDYAAAKFWFDVLQTFGMAAMSLWIWIANRSAARKAEIETREAEVDAQLEKVRERTTIVEQRLAAVPDHHDLKEIHERINETNTTLSTLLGEFQAARRQLQGIADYLMNQKSK